MILNYVSYASGLVPLVCFFLAKNKFRPPTVWIGVFALSGFITDSIGFFLSLQGKPTLALFNVYALFSFIILSGYFISQFQSKHTKVLLLVCLAVGIVTFIAEVAVIGLSAKLASTSHGLNAIFIIMLSILKYYDLLKTPQIENLWTNQDFIIVTALLFFHAGTVFLFLITNYVREHLPNELRHFWSLGLVLTVISNFTLSYGLLCKRNMSSI